MSKLPLVTGRELEKILLQIGFELKRKKGSHAFYRHGDGRYTTIPHHGGRVISRPLLRQIISQIDISPEEFVNLAGK